MKYIRAVVLTVIFCLLTNYWTSLNLLHLIIAVDLALFLAAFKRMWIKKYDYFILFYFQGLHFILPPRINFSSIFMTCPIHYLLLFITDITICPKRIMSCSKEDWKLSSKPFNPWIYTILFFLMVNIICELEVWAQASRNTSESLFK